MSWVFQASEPRPIVIGQIANSPPNLIRLCVLPKKLKYVMHETVLYNA
jgi:hypothetical protein